jgi:hypothetical protein
MELEHGKNWGYAALIIGLATILLYTYGGIYAFMGAVVSFLGFVLMVAIYMDMYSEYAVMKEKIDEMEKERKQKLAKFTRPEENADSDKHG